MSNSSGNKSSVDLTGSDPGKIPIALTIAGSDSGGGAGIQADLKTFSALGVYGASVITAITAQNTQAVTAIHDVPVDIIEAQLDAVLSDIDVNAIKIGMLSQANVIHAVAAVLRKHTAIPIVLDPVMIAKSGDKLLQDDAIDALVSELLPLATVLTPNLPELGALLNQTVDEDMASVASQARQLLGAGAAAVLVKGGHLDGPQSDDWLLGTQIDRTYRAERIETGNTHGTGCSLSSGIAAYLAHGETLENAVATAKQWITGAITWADKLNVGQGHGPVHHFHALWPNGAGS